MQVDIILKSIGQLLTLAGPARARSGKEMSELGIVEGGAMAIKDGKILAVGTTSQICSQYTAHSEIDASGKVVMPGFVDPHTHVVFMHTREKEFEMRIQGKTYVEISLAGGGIRSSIQAVRDASEDELYSRARKRIEAMIACGTTTLESKSGYGLSTDSELKMLRVNKRLQQDLPVEIVSTFLGAHEFPVEYKDTPQAYIDILKHEMMPRVVDEGLAEYCDIFTEAHVYTIKQSRDVMSAARDLGFKLRFHADEIEPIGGAELAGELGAVSADHLGACSDAGIAALRDAGTIATLLPGTIFSLGMNRYARARDMIAAGLPVALATDFNPGSCNCDSMAFVLSLACVQMRMTPAEAICAATINAAYALERGDRIGSLEAGKEADFLIMDMPGYQYLPYHIGSSAIEAVYKSGIKIW